MPAPRSYREVQDTLGDVLVKGMRAFIQKDIEPVAMLVQNQFKHVGDSKHRLAIARAYYEARWIYKAGLALLVDGDERSAHVRAQVLGYGTVCEGLLSDVVGYALTNRRFSGRYFRWANPPKCTRAVPVGAKYKHPFYNLILICIEEGVISASLGRRLQRLRPDRNTVHSRVAAADPRGRFYLAQGKSHYQTVLETIEATKRWKAAH